MRDLVTIDQALSLNSPLRSIIRVRPNTLAFNKFEIRESDAGNVLFQCSSDGPPSSNGVHDTYKYFFSTNVLRRSHVVSYLDFDSNEESFDELRLVENLYFGDNLLQRYEFCFGEHCSAQTSHRWRMVYNLNCMHDEELIQDIVAHPFKTQLDSFFFGDGVLLRHVKTLYSYH